MYKRQRFFNAPATSFTSVRLVGVRPRGWYPLSSLPYAIFTPYLLSIVVLFWSFTCSAVAGAEGETEGGLLSLPGWVAVELEFCAAVPDLLSFGVGLGALLAMPVLPLSEVANESVPLLSVLGASPSLWIVEDSGAVIGPLLSVVWKAVEEEPALSSTAPSLK